MIEKIIYVTNDGKEFSTKKDCIKYEAYLKGLNHVCPKCNGECILNSEPIYESVIDEEAMQSFFSPVVYKKVLTGYTKVKCDLCQGHGYTKQAKKPIYKKEIIGYE